MADHCANCRSTIPGARLAYCACVCHDTSWAKALDTMPADEAQQCAMDVLLHGGSFVEMGDDGRYHRIDPTTVLDGN